MTTDTDALLRSADLFALIGADIELRRTAGTDGGEWHGPCPFERAGDDRFAVWLGAPRPHFWCRSCGRRGDAIDYLRERDGLSFEAACRHLGALDLPSLRAHSAPAPPDKPEHRSLSHEWQEAARDVVERCRATLHGSDGALARAYLEGRGLRRKTIERYRLAYSASDQRIAGAFVSRGIVIPWYLDGDLMHVNVRRPTGEPKYWALPGGAPVLFGAASLDGHEVGVLVEGEFDAMLLDQEASDLVGAVAFGGARAALSAGALRHLLPMRRLLVTYDDDEAGEQAAEPLLRTSQRMRRAMLPAGAKDATEFCAAGGLLRDWVIFQLALYASAATKVAETDAGARCGCCGAPCEAYGLSGRSLCEPHAESEYAAAARSHLVRFALELGAMLAEAG